MAYQSIHTGQNIDDGISINTTQNNRLTDLENKVNTLYGKTTPISQGGTGATTAEEALTNLGLPHFYYGTTEPDDSLGQVNDIYLKGLSTSTAVGSVWNYSYTGGIQSLVIPETGLYKLEISGARGGTIGNSKGGSGGSTTMHYVLSKGQTIYICCGGVGGEKAQVTNVVGYNGGGYSGNDNGGQSCGGGGCTHIATMTGTLSAIGASNLSTVLCVAGGGGGGVSALSSPGGAGGGATGDIGTSSNGTYNTSTYLPQGGTQTGPGYAYGGTARQGAFGRGMAAVTTGWGGGGGGGLYGGGNGHGTTGSGGSGYIASSSTAYNGVTYQNGTVTGQNYGVGTARITLIDAISGGMYLKTASGWIKL